MSPHPYRRFIAIFLCSALCLSILVIVFNWIVDPYQIHQSPAIEGFNQIKVETENHNRLHKALEIAHQKPKAILLGSSRVMGGFNPEDLTAITHEYAYNGGMGGASFEEVYHYFMHALYHQPELKTVLIGIDGFGFNRYKEIQKDCILGRLSMPGLIWKDITTSLFSRAALYSSYNTIRQNQNQADFIFFPHGQYNPALLNNPSRNEIRARGDIQFVKAMFCSVDSYRNYEVDEKKVELFKNIVNTCQEKGIDLHVFISPPKALYWEALSRRGLGPQIEKLKEQLCAIYPIWDFSGYNSITMQMDETESTPYYFECSHFTPYVGKMILRKLFNQTGMPTDFGQYLTPATLAQCQETYQKQRAVWVMQNPEVIQELTTALSTIP